MTDTQNQPVGPQYLMLRFCVVTLVTLALMALIQFLLSRFTPYDIGSGTGIVAAMVPALDAGQTYARRNTHRPESGEAWKLAALFTVLSTLISFVLFFVIGLLLGDNLFAMVRDIGVSVFLVITVIVMAVYLLIIRFFFGFGAKSEMKRQARLAEKQQ